jgi:hypothetical protein
MKSFLKGTIVCLGLVIVLFSVASCSLLYKKFGGDFEGPPEEMNQNISPAAKELIKQAFQGFEGKKIVDIHSHIVGLGAGGTGVMINEEFNSWWHPYKRIQFKIYLSATGIEDVERADQEYIERLVRLIKASPEPMNVHILAFDKHYTKEGSVDLKRTEFYVPNQYVYDLSLKYPQIFTPVISVHPYKKGAVEELDKWGKSGVKFVKWLPNAMGMDPGDESLREYYLKMKEHDMVLLTHAGKEMAVEADRFQKLGNPLRLRLPLDLGVKVIIAHCASLGDGVDLDNSKTDKKSNFDLFLRMMDEEKYKGLLFGDISAMLQFNRLNGPVKKILARPDLHSRLINGSDYPLPGINFLIRTKELLKKGYINKEERAALNEIYSYNPLLFDFVLKRTLRHPETGQKLRAEAFTSPF